jgi:NDP-sugar pyrophosphorylase family protein
MQAVVLCGGLGTRLGERCRERPKYLVEVAGRPFACWQLARLAASGFREVLLLAGHQADRIRAALGDGGTLGLRLGYEEDGPELLGTGGALRAAHDRLAPTFLVTYGDSLLPFDYAAPLLDLRRHPEALGTLSVYRNEGRLDRSNTRVDGERVVAYRKGVSDPSLVDIDYGAMALRREAVLRLPAGTVRDLGALQADLAEAGRLRAHRVTGRFYEIGSPAGLEDLERALGAGELR